MTRVKICGLTRIGDVESAVELGASAVGFVLEHSSPRQTPFSDLARLIESVPPFVMSVAVIGRFEPSRVYNAFSAVQAIGVTLDRLEPSQIAISVYRPGSGDPLPAPEGCSAILLDAYSTEGFGGTGRRLDLQEARDAMAESTRPIIVAGGLRPENVGEVIRELRPFAVDVSSGVESRPGVKDLGAMRAFFEAVADADRPD